MCGFVFYEMILPYSFECLSRFLPPLSCTFINAFFMMSFLNGRRMVKTFVHSANDVVV